MSLGIRVIKKVNDGTIRRVTEGIAANMVSKGLYEYADDGPDDRTKFIKANLKTLDKLEKKSTPVVEFNKDLTPIKPQVLGRSTKPKRIIKDTISEEKLAAIKAVNLAQPARSYNTRGEEFSSLIKHTQDKLRKQQTPIELTPNK